MQGSAGPREEDVQLALAEASEAGGGPTYNAVLQVRRGGFCMALLLARAQAVAVVVWCAPASGWSSRAPRR